MNRAVRALAILALGWGLVLAPVPTLVGSPVVAVAQEQHAPPSGDKQPGESGLSSNSGQRYVVGGLGAALIVVVLVSRKLRGKSMIGIRWRKRS
ncbi:hypothetical protein FHX42_004251 [Saccharopolyspora lacisalsi]|uniref:MYXO-CTERM domain-containing protein n=1 Tax=Halosaccharopolyspora lacisalsi TaxID=1000566 RepID=A0A839DY35_9PSEU|nr:hypothetical protein [Halosaccharopolyspora lacisalsi]MBA8826872.1 hypothetical protein [Halosaccharopolyspora lacisalsi]